MKLLILLTLLSCASVDCITKCGVFPDGCMTECKGRKKAEKDCKNGFVYYQNYKTYKCNAR
jgi:hypothetical protein